MQQNGCAIGRAGIRVGLGNRFDLWDFFYAEAVTINKSYINWLPDRSYENHVL